MSNENNKVSDVRVATKNNRNKKVYNQNYYFINKDCYSGIFKKFRKQIIFIEIGSYITRPQENGKHHCNKKEVCVYIH